MTATNPAIRDARIDEAPLVLEIWRAAFQDDDLHGNLNDVQRVILDDYGARLLLAEADVKIVGTLIASFDGWRGNMYRLAVLPEYQRSGIARAMVTEAEKWLRAVGCRRVTALVDKGHSWATGFWTSAGYIYEDFMARYSHDI